MAELEHSDGPTAVREQEGRMSLLSIPATITIKELKQLTVRGTDSAGISTDLIDKGKRNREER